MASSPDSDKQKASASNFNEQKASSSDSEEQQYQFVNNVLEAFSREDADIPICIFKVPNSLRALKPEAYFPQVVGLGPIHHTLSELGPMQMYKVDAAKQIHEGFGRMDFKELLGGLLELVPSVRACYQMYLNNNDLNIACIMAIDGTRLAQDGILGDTMMLENQIPILVLKNILLMECSDPLLTDVAREKEKKSPVVEEYLPKMPVGYCKALSPLKVLENYPACLALRRTHLLDLLYHLIVLKEPFDRDISIEEGVAPKEKARAPEATKGKEKEGRYLKYLQKILGVEKNVLKAISNLSIPQAIKKLIEIVRGLSEISWTTDLPPSPTAVRGEILIPTASLLRDVGVKFLPVDHITRIEFDRIRTLFKLPVITLHATSGVIIRNLVAYEVMSKEESESLVFTRYFAMMNGIIETAEDVKVLRNHGILKNDKSIDDDEVAKIFRGMSNPILLANAPVLDKAVTDVNKYYNGLRKVKALKFVKKWGLTLWRIGLPVAIFVVLLLFAFQSSCSLFGCGHIFKKISN